MRRAIHTLAIGAVLLAASAPGATAKPRAEKQVRPAAQVSSQVESRVLAYGLAGRRVALGHRPASS